MRYVSWIICLSHYGSIRYDCKFQHNFWIALHQMLISFIFNAPWFQTFVDVVCSGLNFRRFLVGVDCRFSHILNFRWSFIFTYQFSPMLDLWATANSAHLFHSSLVDRRCHSKTSIMLTLITFLYPTLLVWKLFSVHPDRPRKKKRVTVDR